MLSQRTALNSCDDERIRDIKPLIPPQILMEDMPLTLQALSTISTARSAARNVILGREGRLLVIVGPCSIHDAAAAIEYAKLLKAYSATAPELLIIMRVYFEKPRTTVGWKGLINDPSLDGTFSINKGLRTARQLLLSINELGVPCGCEFLVYWRFGVVGCNRSADNRVSSAQVKLCFFLITPRELASGLSCSVGFKNGTDGNTNIAIDAIRAASTGHHFLSVTKQGLSAIIATQGNDACHVILRGSTAGPNYSRTHVAQLCADLEASNVNSRVMIDCSHGNSEKQHKKQIVVVDSICEQLVGECGASVVGVMIESNINEGKQALPETGPADLEYGVSITDACIGWEDTVVVLDRLRKAVGQRLKIVQ